MILLYVSSSGHTLFQNARLPSPAPFRQSFPPPIPSQTLPQSFHPFGSFHPSAGAANVPVSQFPPALPPVAQNTSSTTTQDSYWVSLLQRPDMPTSFDNYQSSAPPAMLARSANYNSTSEWKTYDSPFPYDLTTLPTNVRVCYGCRKNFAEKYRSNPHDLIVRHRDKRIVSVNPPAFSRDFTFTYYHLNLQHIMNRNPFFAGRVELVNDGIISGTQIEMTQNAGFEVHCSEQ